MNARPPSSPPAVPATRAVAARTDADPTPPAADGPAPPPQGAAAALEAMGGYVADPALLGESAAVVREFGAHGQRAAIRLARANAGQVSAAAAAVRAAARRSLAHMPVLDIVAVIDRVIARMLDPDDPGRREAERLLPVITGFDPEMVRLGLNAALKAFRRPQLLRWLAEDFGEPGLLDDFRPRPRGGWSRAYGPRLLGHVWAGNVPALPLWTLVAGLLTKTGTVGKLPSDEPWFAGWFARTLAAVEPRLADTVAVLWWPGDDLAANRALAAEAEVLIVYGGDTAIASWHALAPAGTRVLAHGHRISAGLVAAAALDTRQAQSTARLAALDLARWDQQGCYSPQCFYVERGGPVAPEAFAQLLAGELAALAHRYTQRKLTLEEAQAAARWRQGLERRALGGEGRVSVLGSPHSPWGVAYLDAAGLAPGSALNRTACVVAVDRLEDAIDALAVHGAHLQTVGIAADPARLFALAPRLGEAGFTRICALGATAQPEPGWHHDGRYSLLDLVRVVDIDMSAEQAAEAHAPYRD
ncbi:acyl-CoA reductase [Verticiella sediminum]|uniref:Acyl-CoA reductase n=1 Tax=Verticiella sediminum TaxID=1247510 RepID=A0A556AEC9_9BURK|nr:acyl-CoA reductase [Verticiella sediminum]TSH91237.1 acyl-CoA reductase [Verticiella sediminum]